MATALAEIEEKVRALSQSDKAALIRLLIGELDGPPEPDIEVDLIETILYYETQALGLGIVGPAIGSPELLANPPAQPDARGARYFCSTSRASMRQGVHIQ